jgi:hypothetical protein
MRCDDLLSLDLVQALPIKSFTMRASAVNTVLALGFGFATHVLAADDLSDPIFEAIDSQDKGLKKVNKEVIHPFSLAFNPPSLHPRRILSSLLHKQIWENPEIGYQEVHAHKVLTDFLEDQGFNVTRKAYNLSTAFRAEFTSGEGRVVSFNSEYDALPGLGHACGHNLIATVGVAAAIGLKEALENHEINGTVV